MSPSPPSSSSSSSTLKTDMAPSTKTHKSNRLFKTTTSSPSSDSSPVSPNPPPAVYDIPPIPPIRTTTVPPSKTPPPVPPRPYPPGASPRLKNYAASLSGSSNGAELFLNTSLSSTGVNTSVTSVDSSNYSTSKPVEKVIPKGVLDDDDEEDNDRLLMENLSMINFPPLTFTNLLKGVPEASSSTSTSQDHAKSHATLLGNSDKLFSKHASGSFGGSNSSPNSLHSILSSLSPTPSSIPSTKPLSLDLSKLKSQRSASVSSPQFGDSDVELDAIEEGSDNNPELPSTNVAKNRARSFRTRMIKTTRERSAHGRSQGMSFSKWSELINNSGGFAKINNNISPNNSPLPANLDDGGDTSSTTETDHDVLSSHDSSDMFDQLEDILSYQQPVSPRYRTYSTTSNTMSSSVTSQMDNPLGIEEMDPMQLQYALSGSRGSTAAISEWMQNQHVPSLRESISQQYKEQHRRPRSLSNKSRKSINSRSAVNLNREKSIADDVNSEKSTSFTEGDASPFKPKRTRRKSVTHLMVNASVCLNFSLDNFKGLNDFIKQERERLIAKRNDKTTNQTSDDESENHEDNFKIGVQLHVLHRMKKSDETYAWIPLAHTNDVTLYESNLDGTSETKYTNDHSTIHFETTANIKFHFEKIIPLLFALVSTQTNIVLGSYEGCLAEICGSQQLTIRRKLIKQKKHFCDILIQATLPPKGKTKETTSEPVPRKSTAVDSSTIETYIGMNLRNEITSQTSPRTSPIPCNTEVDDDPLIQNVLEGDSPIMALNPYIESFKPKRRKKLSVVEEIYLDFGEITTKLEKKFKDCFLVVSQKFFSEKDPVGSFIPLYTSETNTKLTKTPTFEPFSIKPTLDFKRIQFRFELFYWESVDKQQDDMGNRTPVDMASPRYRKFQHKSVSDSSTTGSQNRGDNPFTVLGHYKTLIGATEVSYHDFIKFFDLPSYLNESKKKPSETKDEVLLGPFFHISSTGLTASSDKPKKNRNSKNTKSVTFQDSIGGSSSAEENKTPLVTRMFVDRRVHTIKEETLAPQGMDPIEDEHNLAVVHRRRKVLSVVNVESGSLIFKKVKERKVQIEEQTELDVTYSFLDYMKTGLRFKCYFAMDFTKDNTEPRNEENLHKPPKGQKSIYEQCMESISKRIIQYEPNMTDFHLVGFGNDRSTPVFNLYSNEDDEISSVNQILSSPYFRDLSSSEDKTQNYIFSVLYPRYYPPLRIHQLSPIYRQYVSGVSEFKLSMQDCVKTSHYAFTETNIHQGTRSLTNANRFSLSQNTEDITKNTEFVHLNYLEGKTEPPLVNFSHISTPVATPVSPLEDDKRNRRNSTGTKGNIVGQRGAVYDMLSKYAPNDYFPIVSDVIDLSCNLKNEESITQTLLYLYRERQKAKKERNSNEDLSLSHISPVLYNVLVIMIPNDYIHVEETIYKFVEASHKAALSIIIIGVGSGCSFKTHRSINMDVDAVSNISSCSSAVGSSGGERKSIQFRIQQTIPTTSDLQYRGLRAARSCVTFVRLNDYETVNEAIEAGLKDIPKQVCRYMKMKGKEILAPSFK